MVGRLSFQRDTLVVKVMADRLISVVVIAPKVVAGILGITAGSTQGAGSGGSIELTAGLSLSGTHGTLGLYSAEQDHGVVISNAGVQVLDKVGFYAATPVAKQTGVAVTAGAIHAALVNLGLIAA